MPLHRLSDDGLLRFHIRLLGRDRARVECYRFDRGPYAESDELVWLAARQEDLLLYDVRLLHIDPEMLEVLANPAESEAYAASGGEPGQQLLEVAQGYVVLSAQQRDELIATLESKLSPAVSASPASRRYFTPLDPHQLERLHLIVKGLPLDSWYQYHPDPGIASSDQISVVESSTQTTGSADSASTSLFLQVVTFDASSLSNPAFRPRDTFGTGHLTLNEPALAAFIHLVRPGEPQV
ncbi:MAG TPA: hypothetical protein VF818_06985 [Ktedonobacterales bacterium]